MNKNSIEDKLNKIEIQLHKIEKIFQQLGNKCAISINGKLQKVLASTPLGYNYNIASNNGVTRFKIRSMHLNNCILTCQQELANVTDDGHLTDRNNQPIVAKETDTTANIKTIKEHEAHGHDDSQLMLTSRPVKPLSTTNKLSLRTSSSY